MANATLTSQVTKGATVTSLATTAMADAANSGEVIWVGLTWASVEAYTVSSGVGVGDTTVHVSSQTAANTHIVGAQVAPNHTLSAVGRTSAPLTTPRGRRL